VLAAPTNAELRKRRDSIVQLRIDLMRVRRELCETRDELTPLRPSSRADVTAAFASANTYSDLAAARLAK
jgi:hypothetical protein